MMIETKHYSYDPSTEKVKASHERRSKNESKCPWARHVFVTDFRAAASQQALNSDHYVEAARKGVFQWELVGGLGDVKCAARFSSTWEEEQHTQHNLKRHIARQWRCTVLASLKRGKMSVVFSEVEGSVVIRHFFKLKPLDRPWSNLYNSPQTSSNISTLP